MLKTTPFLSSKTIWGGFLSIFPFLYEALPEVVETVLPVLPPHVAPIVSAVGGLLAIFGRFNPNIKPLSVK